MATTIEVIKFINLNFIYLTINIFKKILYCKNNLIFFIILIIIVFMK